jgi:hypothetical protein
MNMNSKKYPAAVFLFLSCLAAQAQTTDFGIWTSMETEKKVNSKWSLNGELELRTSENSGEINRWGLKLGSDYSIVRNLKVGAACQFLYFHDMEYADFQPRRRLIAFVQGKQKFGNFVFSLRERFQATTKDESDRIKKSGKIDAYKINPDRLWRNRLKVEYDIPGRRFTPALSVETFYQLNNPAGNQFESVRSILSVTYKLDRKSAFDISGIYDREINVQDPQNKLVLGINYSYSF